MLNIVFKNGEVITYTPDVYTDYSYDGRCFIVINHKQWIGIYNMDCISTIRFESDDTPAGAGTGEGA